MARDPTLTLQRDDWRIGVRPALGGALTRCDVRRDGQWQAVLRPAPDDADDVLQTACFVTVPFFGRVRHDRFVFRGQQVHLPQLAAHGRALHGYAWRAGWDVVAQGHDRIEIEYAHSGAGWPWPFVASQEFTLVGDGLVIELRVRNTGDAPMPCGIGLHPYFPCNADTRLDARVDARVLLDAQLLAVGAASLGADDGLRQRALHDADMDDGFEGWDGVARILQRSMGANVEMRASAGVSRLHVYAPAGADFFCAEPIGHRIDALNLDEADFAGAGLVVLAPGHETRMSLRLAHPIPAHPITQPRT